MSEPDWDALAPGTQLPPIEMPPLTRQQLAIYCGSYGDHNHVHVDIDFAKQAGLGDVIAHGMLIMAYSGRALTSWIAQQSIKKFDTRFMAMTRIGDAITVTGTVIEKFVDQERRYVRIELAAADQRGEQKTAATALLELR